MRAIRFVIVLTLLATVPATGFSQLLPRRRAAWDALMERAAVDAVSRMKLDLNLSGLFKDWDFKELFKNRTPDVDFALSIQLFAEFQMETQLKKRIEGAANETDLEALAREVLDKGSARVFLSETEKFSELLTKEEFAPPVLEKIYVEYQYSGDRPFREGLGPDGQFSTRTITPREFFFSASGSSNDASPRRVVAFYESKKRKDQKDANPVTAHCALVFSTSRQGKEIEKILWLDLYLEEMKMDPARRAFPWKVKNVQHN